MVTATFFHLLFHINVLYYLYLVNALNGGYMCNSIGWQRNKQKPPEKWKVNFEGWVGFLTGQMLWYTNVQSVRLACSTPALWDGSRILQRGP